MTLTHPIAALLVLLAVLFIFDWRQTLNIARSNGRWYERNPALAWLMRRVDPVRAVHLWFALCAALLLAVVTLLPWQLALPVVVLTTAAEAWCVRNNRRLGIPA